MGRDEYALIPPFHSHSLSSPTMLSLLLFLLFQSPCQSSDRLSPLNLCSDYTACKRESLSMEYHCDHLETLEGKQKRRVEFVAVKNERVVEDTSICGVDLHPEYTKLRKHLSKFRKEVNRCIAESLIKMDDDGKEEMNEILQQYCDIATSSNPTKLSSLSSSIKCWKTAKFVHRRCADLRRCCEPAMICEQKASRSRNGKSMTILREEIGYRLADCRSMRGGERHKLFHKMDAIRRNQSNEERKNSLKKSIKRNNDESTTNFPDSDKIVISIKAPMPTDIESLCSPYITCANHLFDYRLKCSAAQEISKAGTNYDFHLAYLQLPPLDENDEECREEWKELIEKAIGDQRRVGQYMEKCVQNGGKYDAEMNGCNLDVFSSPSPPIISSFSSLNSTCRVEEKVRKGRCNALRSCCPHAQKCEDSQMYESLANDFISSSIDLKKNMNECYKKGKNRR